MGALFSRSNGRGHARSSKVDMIALVRGKVTEYAEEQKTSWSTTIGGWSFIGGIVNLVYLTLHST